MTKIRIKSVIIITISLLFLPIPIAFSQTKDVGFIGYIIFLAVPMAYLIESYTTFQLIKITDDIEPIHKLYFTRMTKCGVMLYIFTVIIVGVPDLYHMQTSHFIAIFSPVMFLCTISLQGLDGIGNKYISIGNRYIKLEDVEMCDKTTSHRNSNINLAYLIHMKNGKTYKLNMAQNDLKISMEAILDEKLQVYEMEF